MIEKKLRSGQIGYYWNPPKKDIAKGFILGREALGSDYSAAIARAEHLNLILMRGERG
jgi:hypothetical protein